MLLESIHGESSRVNALIQSESERLLAGLRQTQNEYNE